MVPALHPGSHAPSLAPRLSCSQPCTNHHSFLPLTNSLHVLLVFSLFNLPTSLVTRLLYSGFCPQSLSHNLCTGVQDPTSYLGSLSYQVSWSQASHVLTPQLCTQAFMPPAISCTSNLVPRLNHCTNTPTGIAQATSLPGLMGKVAKQWN